jgi:16S rRNA (cytosine1402-N4)-methyltransferase
MSSELSEHEPVLLEEVMQAISMVQASGDDKGLRVLDATVGGAGHSSEILERFENTRLLGVDRDMKALGRAELKLRKYRDHVVLAHGNFCDLEEILNSLSDSELEILKWQPADEGFDAILVDLGISSDQLNDPSRGFSFRSEDLADMRMDQTQAITASQLVNESSAAQLSRIFKKGGVGGASQILAKEIEKRRPVKSAKELAELCDEVLARFSRKKRRKSRYSTVPFQALRIEVNKEFESLEKFLAIVPEFLKPGGVLAVISFHSLEDRLVARQMREWSRLPAEHYRLPLQTESEFGRLVSKKAVVPSKHESEKNPRSRSARMRIFCRRAESSQ